VEVLARSPRLVNCLRILNCCDSEIIQTIQT
jgi:hypothetical protein